MYWSLLHQNLFNNFGDLLCFILSIHLLINSFSWLLILELKTRLRCCFTPKLTIIIHWYSSHFHFLDKHQISKISAEFVVSLKKSSILPIPCHTDGWKMAAISVSTRAVDRENDKITPGTLDGVTVDPIRKRGNFKAADNGGVFNFRVKSKIWVKNPGFVSPFALYRVTVRGEGNRRPNPITETFN